MNGKKIPILSIVLYVLAGLFGIYTIWSAYYYYDNISTLVKQGQAVIKGNEFELVSYLMANIAQYLFFGVALASLGRIVHLYSTERDLYFVEDFDDDFDEDFDEEFYEDLSEDFDEEPDEELDEDASDEHHQGEPEDDR